MIHEVPIAFGKMNTKVYLQDPLDTPFGNIPVQKPVLMYQLREGQTGFERELVPHELPPLFAREVIEFYPEALLLLEERFAELGQVYRATGTTKMLEYGVQIPQTVSEHTGNVVIIADHVLSCIDMYGKFMSRHDVRMMAGLHDAGEGVSENGKLVEAELPQSTTPYNCPLFDAYLETVDPDGTVRALITQVRNTGRILPENQRMVESLFDTFRSSIRNKESRVVEHMFHRITDKKRRHRAASFHPRFERGKDKLGDPAALLVRFSDIVDELWVHSQRNSWRVWHYPPDLQQQLVNGSRQSFEDITTASVDKSIRRFLVPLVGLGYYLPQIEGRQLLQFAKEMLTVFGTSGYRFRAEIAAGYAERRFNLIQKTRAFETFDNVFNEIEGNLWLEKAL